MKNKLKTKFELNSNINDYYKRWRTNIKILKIFYKKEKKFQNLILKII